MARRPEKILWRELFAFRADDARPLQMKIRARVVDAILDGTLPPATPMPSSRAMAEALGVSRNTVVLAYQQLVDDGLLVSRERSGFAVSARPRAMPSRPAAEPSDRLDWSGRLRTRASAMRNIEKPADWHRHRFPFLYGQLDATLFPLASWRQCCRQALSVMEMREWTPDRIDEDDALLIEQIRTRLLPRRGIWAGPDEIMITLGAQQALYLLAEALFARDTVVGVEDPGYPDMRNLAALRTNRLVPLAVDADGLVPDRTFTGCDYAYVTPSHQCPTTVTMPLARRTALLAAAADANVVLIEDDYDSETTFRRDPQPALKSVDRSGRVIYVSSLSKMLAPGLRMGFIVADRGLIHELRALRRLMVRHPPVNNQRAVALFLALGHYESLVRRVTGAYRERAQRIGGALAAHLPELAVTVPTGGSSVWLEGPPGFDARAAAAVAERHGLLFEPGDIFFRDPEQGRAHLRLGYSAIPVDRIDEGVALLARVMRGELA